MFDGNGNQKLIWAMAAVFVGGSIWLSVSWNRSSVNALRTQDVVEYQMPRPKAFRKGFDMSDRNLRVKTIHAEKRNTTVAAVPPAAIPAGTTPAKDKKADAKKKAKVAQNKNQRRNQMRVAVVDTDMMMGMSGLEDQGRSQERQQNYYNNQTVQNQQETAKKEETQLTAAQWREILNANPSFAKASEFRAAMMAGNISQGAYYKIVEELLVNTAEEKVSVAIYLLNQDASLPAFEMLVKNQNTVRQSQQSAVKALIENFSQTTRFGTLARALSSANADVAREAARLLDTALTAFNTNSSSSDPRGSRGSASSSTSPASFAVFVMPLTQVSKSTSPIASEAAELLQRIQALI